MSTEETEHKETQISNNGWNNQAICLNFALDNLDPKYQTLFNVIVKLSFGYKEIKTRKVTIDELALRSRLGRRTVIRHISYLVENNFIKAIHPKHNPKGGGSEAYEYAPLYPKGYGKIDTNKNKKSEHNDEDLSNDEKLKQFHKETKEMEW